MLHYLQIIKVLVTMHKIYFVIWKISNVHQREHVGDKILSVLKQTFSSITKEEESVETSQKVIEIAYEYAL